MPEPAETLERRYVKALWSYVADGGEALREQALGLGRESLERGLGILDLAQLQKKGAAGLEPGPAQERAAEFFNEALVVYEMRLRGVQESNAQMQAQNRLLEERVEERSRVLREKEEQLHHAQKLDAMGRLAGGVAHDFNNLLTVIQGYAQLCLEGEDDKDPSTRKLALAQIQKAVERATELTRQLLAFSRHDAAEPRDLDLNAEAADTVRLLQRVVGERGQVLLTPHPQPVLVHMDRGQLQQVLMNLVLNAKDALGEHGRIHLSVNRARLAADHLVGHPESAPGEYAVVSVQDNGAGMDKAVLARLFEPFFSTKGPGRGTGLGLSTVYGIVRQNCGLIVVQSEVGKGSTFKVYLPARGGA